jgi:hypothetical protein
LGTYLGIKLCLAKYFAILAISTIL